MNSDYAIEEIDIIFSTPNSFKRYEKEGIIELLARKADDDDVKVRILLDQNDDIQQSIGRLSKKHPQITIRVLNESIKTKLTTIMADKELSLVIELKDDTQYDDKEAIGLATHSLNSILLVTYSSS